MDTQIFSLEDINGSTSNFVEHIVITRDDPNNFNEKNQLNLSEPAHSLLRYFQYSRGEPFGTCRICQKEIRRTQGNTNGMTKHLMKHPNIFEEFSTAKSAMPPSTRMLKNENSTPLKKQKINGQSEKGLDNITNNGNTILSEDYNEIDETIIDLSKPPHSLLRYYQYDRGDPSAICRICQKRISRKKGNTKGTTRHLMLHPSFFKQFAMAKNVEIPKMDDAILRFICLSSQSLSITEQESFTDMFSLACPNYTVKNREYMTNLITKKFQSKYSGLKDALRKCQSCSFTTAIRHSKGQYFLSVTCHYIDDSFNRCWKVLAAEPITGENTSNAITNKINEIFVDFGISPTKVHLFLRDAASSMCRSVEALSVSDGSNLPEISKQIQICRELVAFYNWSSAFQNALSRQQQLVDAPKNPLIGEIPTQWTSTLTMARRVIEQQNALLAACLDFQDVTLPNFEFLKKILNILQPFESKTKLLSNRNECISSVLPTYKYLLNCLAENPCDSSEERSFKRTISDGLRCRMDGLIDRRIGADPLEYWRKAANNNSYPNLRKLAKIFLSAPPSSSESERVVSRLVESEGIREASSVNGQLAKAQMFLHFNYDN
uniref:BED-type domain-containing protein n=1 Tax=Meloidogyne javanica TaxID=6303 RepID=A0A915M6Q3_MELJA